MPVEVGTVRKDSYGIVQKMQAFGRLFNGHAGPGFVGYNPVQGSYGMGDGILDAHNEDGGQNGGRLPDRPADA